MKNYLLRLNKPKIVFFDDGKIRTEGFTLRENCPSTEFFAGPYFPVVTINGGKYGPEKKTIFTQCYILNTHLTKSEFLYALLLKTPVLKLPLEHF